MAGLSGLVKKITDLVSGTPSDDDCFIFGKTALKKITWESIKNLITARTNTAVSTTLGINANLYKRAGVVYFRFGGYLAKELGTSYEEVGTIPEGWRVPTVLTLVFPQNATQGRIIYVQLETSGRILMKGGVVFEQDSPVNVMLTYVT